MIRKKHRDWDWGWFDLSFKEYWGAAFIMACFIIPGMVFNRADLEEKSVEDKNSLLFKNLAVTFAFLFIWLWSYLWSNIYDFLTPYF